MGQEHKTRKPVELMMDEMRVRNPAMTFNHYFVDSVTAIAQSFKSVNVAVCKTPSTEPSLVLIGPQKQIRKQSLQLY